MNIINIYQDSLHTLLELLPSTLGTALTTLRSNISTLVGNTLTLINDTQEKIITLQDQLEDELNSLKINNAAITSAITAELNEKQINNIYMQVCFSGPYSLDTLEFDAVYSIASQCPETGGAAVYKARALLLLWDEFYDFVDEDLCEEPAPKILSQNDRLKGDILVYPNPFHNQITIETTGDNSKQRVVDILGLDGKVIKKFNLNGGQSKLLIDLNSIPSAMYFIRLISEDGVKIQKLIKQ